MRPDSSQTSFSQIMLTTGLRITALTALACASFLLPDGTRRDRVGRNARADVPGGAQTHFGATTMAAPRSITSMPNRPGAAALDDRSIPARTRPRSRGFSCISKPADDDAASPCQVRLSRSMDLSSMKGRAASRTPAGLATGSPCLPTPMQGPMSWTIVNLEKSGPLGAPPWFMGGPWPPRPA